MSEETLEILRSAITISRNEQVKRLSVLRKILENKFPGKTSEIEEAIATWAEYESRKDAQ